MCAEKDAKVPDFIEGILLCRNKGNREDYCIIMMILFKPWHTGNNLKTSNLSWNNAFLNYKFTQ